MIRRFPLRETWYENPIDARTWRHPPIKSNNCPIIESLRAGRATHARGRWALIYDTIPGEMSMLIWKRGR
jgi:hypothetical protein